MEDALSQTVPYLSMADVGRLSRANWTMHNSRIQHLICAFQTHVAPVRVSHADVLRALSDERMCRECGSKRAYVRSVRMCRTCSRGLHFVLAARPVACAAKVRPVDHRADAVCA